MTDLLCRNVAMQRCNVGLYRCNSATSPECVCRSVSSKRVCTAPLCAAAHGARLWCMCCMRHVLCCIVHVACFMSVGFSSAAHQRVHLCRTLGCARFGLGVRRLQLQYNAAGRQCSRYCGQSNAGLVPHGMLQEDNERCNAHIAVHATTARCKIAQHVAAWAVVIRRPTLRRWQHGQRAATCCNPAQRVATESPPSCNRGAYVGAHAISFGLQRRRTCAQLVQLCTSCCNTAHHVAVHHTMLQHSIHVAAQHITLQHSVHVATQHTITRAPRRRALCPARRTAQRALPPLAHAPPPLALRP